MSDKRLKLPDVGLTSMQNSKLNALVSQGGSLSAATVIVHMPSGELLDN